MLTISHACPRCGHEKSIFSIVWADSPNQAIFNGIREVVGRCVHCQRHVIAVFMGTSSFAFTGNAGMRGDISNWGDVNFIEMLPDPDYPGAPDNVPDKVGKAYVEGRVILARAMWTPAAGSFRTSLDRATQILWAGLQTEDVIPFKLDVRLKKLAEKLSIPPSMMEWADTVRVVGNELHDLDDVSQEDAEDAAHFVETFLTYMFTLPSRVAAFKERRA